MRISVITVTKNSSSTIADCVRSVKKQDYRSVEHIIKDAISNDRTIDLAQEENENVVIKRSVDYGIYDAMNQGYALSSGDIICYLNSDDYYFGNDVLSQVVDTFKKNNCDIVYGNLIMIGSEGSVYRHWKPKSLDKKSFVQIPHPAIFVKREFMEKLALPFDPKYKIAGDLKQQLIFVYRMNVKAVYIDVDMAVMRIGGTSTNSMNAYIKGWIESYKAHREVVGRNSALFVLKKVLSKIDNMVGVK